jgi:serine/threonine protein kinase
VPQLIAAVASLHDAGLVHGDIKPDNVLVAYGGRVVLLDYGLVAEASPSPVEGVRTAPHGPAGTPAYLAPESCERDERLPASDWYSVGLLVFEALTGTLPFTGGAAEVVIRKRSVTAPRSSAFIRNVPPDLDDLCARLLETEPSRRPSSGELAELAVAVSATR